MDLKTWILQCVKEFEFVVINERTDEDDAFLCINNGEEYIDFVKAFSEDIFISCYTVLYKNDTKYFLCWDNGTGYVFKLRLFSYGTPEYRWEAFFNTWIFGNTTWKKKLIAQMPELLENCGDCPCYNDKLTTGYCYGKNTDIGVKIWS